MADRNLTASEDPGKRQAILEQAIHTFAEMGFHGADVQVIADRAGVGKGTVYRYFGSKQDLFWATTLEVMQRLDHHVFAAMEGVDGVCAKLRAASIAHGEFFQANPHYLDVFVKDRAEFPGPGPESHRKQHDAMIHRTVAILEQGIEQGELRPVDPRLTTLALGCMLYGTAVLGSHLDAENVTRINEQSIDLFLRGLCAETDWSESSIGRPDFDCLTSSQRRQTP
ncbi:MAG: TetR family transcriptional regulator [Pirellulales bacterium]